MTGFDPITPFTLIRGIGLAGPTNPAIYLLICGQGTADGVENDLLGEIRAQLGDPVQAETVSELLSRSLPFSRDSSTRLIRIDRWLPDLVDSLDKHSALLVQDGSQLLFLAEEQTAEQLLKAAPNLRNRLAGVFHIEPEDLSGGGTV
ncbi:MAG TPA: hypothetical protein VME43_31860 [Bryobacteraceae bacterium]|nr:hypothetical protein [Bryobacteraceae bacterium]